MTVKTLSQRETEILEKAVEVLKRNLHPDKIILFGSRGKGKFQKYSDFDLAVSNGTPDIRTERRISEEIEEIAGLYKIDIVYLNSVDEEFKDIILKTGEVKYERRGKVLVK